MRNGNAVTVYFCVNALEALDAEVEKRATADREQGLSGYAVTNRSKLISEIVSEYLFEKQDNEFAITKICETCELKDSQLSVPTIQAVTTPIARRFDVEYVSLFGSYARGEQTANSDIDLFVKKGSIKGMEIFDFQQCLEKALGKKIDIVTSTGAGAHILKRIYDEEIVLYAS